jgi:hypothetical protein
MAPVAVHHIMTHRVQGVRTADHARRYFASFGAARVLFIDQHRMIVARPS